jgi:hypothetical protein
VPLGDDQAVAVSRSHEAIERLRRKRAVPSAGLADQFRQNPAVGRLDRHDRSL